MIQDRFVDLSSLCFIMNIFYVLLDTNGASERLFVKFTKAKQFGPLTFVTVSISCPSTFKIKSIFIYQKKNQVNFIL